MLLSLLYHKTNGFYHVQNAKKQLKNLNQKANTETESSKPEQTEQTKELQQPPQGPTAHGALVLAPWNCHSCESKVPGHKSRCPFCRSWKGGVRKNAGKTEQTWACLKCKKENLGRKVRCAQCQGWRECSYYFLL